MSAVEETAPQPDSGSDLAAEQQQNALTKNESQPQASSTVEQEEPPKPEVSSSRSGVCGVCNENPGKYKCPRCRMLYCSVACNKTHKENHPPDPPPTETPKPIPADTSEKPTPPDPSNPFGVLETSEKLRVLFEKYPRLPDQLIQIHDATRPPSSSTTPFDPSESRRLEKAMWDRSTGLRKGKEALQRAREAEGEEGDGVREYHELVLHLLSNGADGPGPADRRFGQRDEELLRNFVAAETRHGKD